MLGIAAYPDDAAARLVDVAPPGDVGSGEVLCRTLELGVCGTDREILASRQPSLPEGEDFLLLGHECLAVIDDVGPGVSDVSVGELVVPIVRRAAPGASKRRVDMLAFGDYTERGIIREHGFSTPYWTDRPEHLFRVEPALRSVAVLAEPLAVAEKGINEAVAVQRARLGEKAWTATPPRVLVTGMGPIGFAAMIGCRCRGWPTTMYGRDGDEAFRPELARRFGASYLSSQDARFDARDVENDGFDLVLECTGSDEVLVSVSAALASCGAMVWLGSSRTPEPKRLDMAALIRHGLLRNHVHLGSVNAAPRDFRGALAHLRQTYEQQPAALADLITARVSPDESLWHYQHRRPQGIKTVLVYP